MSLFKSIATFGGFTFISRITGFVRDMVLANYLGAGTVSDAFFVSFKLPNLFRSLFAEGAFTSAFVPLFSQKLVKEGKKKSVFFAAQALSVLFFVLLLFVVLFEIFMPYVVRILAPGFAGDAGKIELAANLCRVTFPFLLFISIVSFQAGILNAFEKFAAPATAPIILNVTMIAAAFAVVPFISAPAYGFAASITLAGVLEILWLQYALRRIDIRIKPFVRVRKIFQNGEIKTLFRRIAPGVVGAGIYQINMVVDTILVSIVGTGAISWLYYANRLQQLPLGVVGAAIGVAVLPILSKQLKLNDVSESKKTQDKAVEYAAILSIPAAVLMIVLALPIVRILFEHGQFGPSDSLKTAGALIAYAFGLPCYVLVKALMPNFFARGDTVTPVKFSAVVFFVNFCFNLLLMKPFGHIGIAVATTIAAFVSLGQYIFGLYKRGFWCFSKELVFKIFKIFLCALLMGISVKAVDSGFVHFFGDWLRFSFLLKLIILGVLGTFGLLTFLIFAFLTRILDIKETVYMFLRRKAKK